MNRSTRFQDSRTRVSHGLERERQIAKALKEQAGLPIREASGDDDKERKVDRWLIYPGKDPVALQIKYRETGDDLLFEVYDKFFDWGNSLNKIGRDMQGIASEYAVLLQDRKTVVMIPTERAKAVIHMMMESAQKLGWVVQGFNGPIFRYFVHGYKLELRVQKDPRDGRQKMMAYIPGEYFVAEEQAKVYRLALPKNWKAV